jgi:hypothetical protein
MKLDKSNTDDRGFPDRANLPGNLGENPQDFLGSRGFTRPSP